MLHNEGELYWDWSLPSSASPSCFGFDFCFLKLIHAVKIRINSSVAPITESMYTATWNTEEQRNNNQIFHCWKGTLPPNGAHFSSVWHTEFPPLECHSVPSAVVLLTPVGPFPIQTLPLFSASVARLQTLVEEKHRSERYAQAQQRRRRKQMHSQMMEHCWAQSASSVQISTQQ